MTDRDGAERADLIRVEDLSTGDANNDSGRYTAQIATTGGVTDVAELPTLTNELYDIESEGPVIDNASFKAITGIVTYFGNPHLAPRSEADFEL